MKHVAGSGLSLGTNLKQDKLAIGIPVENKLYYVEIDKISALKMVDQILEILEGLPNTVDPKAVITDLVTGVKS